MQDKVPQQLTLSNGLRVLFLSQKANSVFLQLLGKVGRRAENHDEVGASHFLEHTFFDGTKKFPDAFSLNKFIDHNGARKNGITSADMVEYWIKIISEKSENAFAYLSDIFFNSLITDKDIAKERKVILEESKKARNDPDDYIMRRRLQTLFPKQSLGRVIFDEEENLPNINRTLLINFLQRNYVKENFILVVAGNIKLDKAMKFSNKYFADFPTGAETAYSQSYVGDSKEVVVESRGGISVSKLSIAFRGYKMFSYDAYVASMLGIILGRGFTSRLMDKLRTKLHLVYGVGAFHSAYSDIGYFGVSTSVSEENIQSVINAIYDEFRKLCQKPITNDELEKARNMYLADIAFESDNYIDSVDGFAQEWLNTGKLRPLEVKMDLIRKISSEDLLRVANEIFSDFSKVNILSKNNIKVSVPDSVI